MKKKAMLITLIAIFMGISIGAVVPMALSPHKEATRVDHEALKASLKEQFKEDFFSLVAEDALTQPKEAAAGTVPDKQVAAAKAKLAALEGTNVPAASAEIKAVQNAEITSNTRTAVLREPGNATPPLVNTPTGKNVKDSWVQSKIDTNRGKISDADLDTGAGIYNSLDTDYLFGMADGGLTPEENIKVQTYLHENLSGREYDIAQKLYYEYVDLLNAQG